MLLRCPTWLPKNELQIWGVAEQRRLLRTTEFIDDIGSPLADLGEPNPFATRLSALLNTPIESVNIDLDNDIITGQYGTIFCFEVIEHLFNPLHCLNQIYRALHKDGILYLTTPYSFLRLLTGKRHFHEIDDKRILWLFDKAGFKVVKKDKISVRWELWKHFTGFRPILRLFSKTRIYKLIKQE